MRVLFISVASIFTVGAILLTIRFWGLSMPVHEFQSEFFTEKKPWLALDVSAENEIPKILKKKPDAILYFNLRLTADQILFVQAPEVFEKSLSEKKFGPENYRGPKPYNYHFEFLKKEFPGIFALEEILKTYPEQRLILNLIDNAQNIHKITVELLRKYNFGKKIIIQSPVDIVLKSIKELEPLWLYGTSQPEVTRLLSLDSLGVLPAASIRSDVFIVPLKIMNRNVFTLGLNEELIRRKKKIMLGPLGSAEEVLQAEKYKVDGYIFRNFSDFEISVEKYVETR